MNGLADLLSDARLSEVSVTCPRVTVVVTNFNYGKFIDDCLASIAAQTYTSFTCVVVDDCSTDDSVDRISTFIAEKGAGRFTLLRHEVNQGQMAAFRTGLANADGPFVVYVDADDLLLPDFLESHVRTHLGNEPVAFTSSNQYQIDGTGSLIGGTHSDLKAKGNLTYVPATPLYTPFWVWATTSSMMFRTAVLRIVLETVSSEYRICADNYVCHFANLLGGSLLIPTVHGCYRRHGSNGFSSNSMIGGEHPTGDMRSHPKHHNVRLDIFSALAATADSLVAGLSKERYQLLLASVAGPVEIIRQKSMSEKSPHLRSIRLVVLATLLRIRHAAGAFMLRKKSRRLFLKYGRNANVMELPGAL